jgi:hypothetical protein
MMSSLLFFTILPLAAVLLLLIVHLPLYKQPCIYSTMQSEGAI